MNTIARRDRAGGKPGDRMEVPHLSSTSKTRQEQEKDQEVPGSTGEGGVQMQHYHNTLNVYIEPKE